MNYKNCPNCGGNNITQSDCGYSNFNMGSIKCECGLEFKTTCSCYPEEELIGFWNISVEKVNYVRKLSKEDLELFAITVLFDKRELADKIFKDIDKKMEIKKMEIYQN